MVVKGAKKFLTALSGFGNTNILGQHIHMLEKDIREAEEDKMDYTLAPHFAAWLRMYCELIANELFHSHYRAFIEENIYKDKRVGFAKMKSEIKKYYDENPDSLGSTALSLDALMDIVGKILELRHCIQHGGIPNILRELSHITIEEIEEMTNPENFEVTKEMFQNALIVTSSLPKKSFAI